MTLQFTLPALVKLYTNLDIYLSSIELCASKAFDLTPDILTPVRFDLFVWNLITS